LSYNEVVITKILFRPSLSFWILLLSAALLSCSSDQNKSLSVASFKENDVEVSINLTQQPNGNFVLRATFIPPQGYHLYSKDIPATGVDGLGRPTLLELTSRSFMKATASLRENQKPQAPDFEPKELLVYPRGPVTLSLPVELPPGSEWLEDELSVTYMACSSGQCKPPVVGKVIPIRIPGAEASEQ
jgi:hypothetical protein